MKKFILTLAVTLIASNAFAAATLNATGSVTLPGFAKSKNVDFAYEGGGSPVDRYSISTKHAQGNKIYGTLSGSTAIYQADGTSGTALVIGNNPTVPTSASDSAITGGIGNWSAM